MNRFLDVFEGYKEKETMYIMLAFDAKYFQF